MWGPGTDVLGLAFLLMLVTAVAYVVVKGGRDERLIAVALVAAAIVTAANYAVLVQDFDAVQPILIVSESLVLGLCLWIAFRSARFWPLVISSLQLATLISLLTPLFGNSLVSRPLGVMQGLWAYLQLGVLVLAVLRRYRRIPLDPPEKR